MTIGNISDDNMLESVVLGSVPGTTETVPGCRIVYRTACRHVTAINSKLPCDQLELLHSVYHLTHNATRAGGVPV